MLDPSQPILFLDHNVFRYENIKAIKDPEDDLFRIDCADKLTLVQKMNRTHVGSHDC